MQITRRADYGVRTMLEVAGQGEGAVAHTHEVAARQGIPRPFLAKIVVALTRAGLLRSRRGSGGGICLAKPAGRITLLEVVEAVDGPISLNRCVLWPEECGRSSFCPAHEVWEETRSMLVEKLGGTTLASLLERAAKRREARGRRHEDSTAAARPEEDPKLGAPGP